MLHNSSIDRRTRAPSSQAGKHRKDEKPADCQRLSAAYGMRSPYFVNEQLWNRFLLNINKVHAKDLLSLIPFIAIETDPYGLYVRPIGVFPITAKHEAVLKGVEAESNVAIVQKAKM